jgi:hypothetical protein
LFESPTGLSANADEDLPATHALPHYLLLAKGLLLLAAPVG